MKTPLRTMAIVLAASIFAAAQGNPDLIGTWMLDTAKSDQPPAPPGRAVGTPPARGTGAAGTTAPSAQLTIASAADGVSITQGTQTVTFKLDGTEAFWFQGGENRGTAAWDAGKLVISWKREFYAGPRQGYVTYTGKDVYSAAGTTLTVEKTTVAPDGTTTKKYVYNKA